MGKHAAESAVILIPSLEPDERLPVYIRQLKEGGFDGIIAAVNHGGDSDSTGAITGNILGAYLGYENIDDRWKKNLELYDVILEMADDLCHGCQMSEYGRYRDPVWIRKYIEMHWKEEKGEK